MIELKQCSTTYDEEGPGGLMTATFHFDNAEERDTLYELLNQYLS